MAIKNWKELFVLFFSKLKIEDRVLNFSDLTDVYSLVVFPLLIGAFMVVVYPWVNLGFLYICRFSTERKNSLQADSEHTLLVKKQGLEKVRSELLAQKEQEILEKAIRDEKVEKIDSTEIREKAQEDITKLRESSETSTPDSGQEENKRALELVKKYEDLANSTSAISERKRYRQKALDILEKLAFSK